MININVNGKELVLFKDTTLNIEYNNALFSKDSMEGDVVYSFDIPVPGNERALNFEHLPYSVSHSKYDCTVNVGGINIITGKLVVQKVTDKKYSVAVLVNPYPEGWKERSIRSNDSDEIVVSSSDSEHRNAWKRFLKSTLSDDRIKFGPFVNEDGYGDKNKDFGSYAGHNRGRICNRVLFNATEDVVESSDAPFIRLFNESISLYDEDDGMYVERNQQCLVPQIRFGRILENVIKNMGYKYIDRITADSDLYGIHIQSPSPLDATGIQFGNIPDWYFLHATRAANQSGFYSVSSPGYCNDNPQGLMWVGNSSQTKFSGVKFQASGWYRIRCEIKPSIARTGEVYFKVAKWESGTMPPTNPSGVTVDAPAGIYSYENETFEYDNTVYIDSSFVGIPLGIGFWLKTNYSGDEKDIWVNGGESSLTIESQAIDKLSYDNLYRNRFHIAECFPNVSNVEFLKAAVQSLGMAMFIDSSSGLAEMIPYREISDAKSLDLTDYVMDNETGMECPEDGTHTFRLSSLEEKDVVLDDLLDEVCDVSDLPSSYLNIGKMCYVKSRNSFFKAEKTQSEDSNWRMEWIDQKFNRQDCHIGGSGDETTFKSGFKVPGNTTCGDYTTPIPSVPFTMGSVMFNTEDISDHIVMLYYRGLERYGASQYQYQDMRPVVPDGFSLNAGSGNSVCEKYIREWRKLVSMSKTIKYRMYLPMLKALEVVQLLKPQKNKPANQVRWIMVDNVKTMPKKISFQIDNNDSLVLCEIEAAKMD